MNIVQRACERFALLMALVFLAGQPLLAQEGQDNPKEAEFIAVLQTGTPGEKAIACKQLAIHGSGKAVPDLEKLLSDEQLSSWARIALEAIPGAAADEALRKAAETLEGKLLVGVINSIGVRKDANAVLELAKRLKDQDPQVAIASAIALGRIGNGEATEALRESLAINPAEVRSAVAEGCILCAEQLIAQDKHSQAAEIYDEVRQAEVPKPRQLEATRGAILARKTDGIPLLIEQLKSPDKHYLQIALSAAREFPGKEVEEALAAELAKATPERTPLLLGVLADRSLTSVPAGVLQIAKSGDKPMRLAAIDLIGRRGSEANLDVLLGIAAEPDADLAKAARQALADLPGDKVNAEIVARLNKASAKSLPVLVAVVGQRRIDAVEPLKKALDHSDKAMRSAALAALGETIAQKDLGVLIAQVVAPKHADQAAQAHQALQAACIRMPDREACATELAAAIAKAQPATKAKLLEILGAMQGKKALETIAVACKGNNDLMIDTGTRLLGDWMTVDAGPVLLDVAKNSSNNKYKVRTLRGYIRLVRQFPVPARQRAEMCQQALDAAIRTDEQKLVLEVLERYPSGDTLRLANRASGIAAIKQDASRVATAIAQKLGGPSANVQDMLAKVGREPVKVEVLKAVYGSGDQKKDVTEALAPHVGSSLLVALPKATYNESLGGDPAPSAKKTLHIQYRVAGKPAEATFNENAPIFLPAPK
jgi:HEAT repeat protein